MSTGANNELEYGAAFVGGYVICCARVEEWASAILVATALNDADGVAPKVPRMLGPKLKAISDLATNQPAAFSKPKRIVELMSRFSQPAKMRSDMAHSTVTPVKNGTDTYYLFRTVDSGERFWMTKTHMESALSDLRKLVKEITDQKAKAITAL
ncbi:MAG TPA: hypothetical protein VGN36_05735 [Sphingorhabdus sp.]|jgi:hypothetical protein|nr:hypothetical protein [Sphingorhabdus sp.]